jgi:hypothetical protein
MCKYCKNIIYQGNAIFLCILSTDALLSILEDDSIYVMQRSKTDERFIKVDESSNIKISNLDGKPVFNKYELFGSKAKIAKAKFGKHILKISGPYMITCYYLILNGHEELLKVADLVEVF